MKENKRGKKMRKDEREITEETFRLEIERNRRSELTCMILVTKDNIGLYRASVNVPDAKGWGRQRTLRFSHTDIQQVLDDAVVNAIEDMRGDE